MKILVVAAHQDDETLGCGATVARLVAEGATASVVHFVQGYGSRDVELQGKNSVEEACKVLGISQVFSLDFPDQRLDTVPFLDLVKSLEKVIVQVKPDTIFTHYGQDLNKDHRLVCEAVLTATRPKPGQQVKTIYSFEIPSSTDWNYPLSFSPNTFFDVSKTMEKKAEAIKHYESEVLPYPHPRSEIAIMTTGIRWGSVSGVEAAEAFQLLRNVQKA